MCGLFGTIMRGPGAPADIDNIFKQGLYADAVRGKHGTGIAAINVSGGIQVYKRALCSSDFLELPKTKSLIEKVNVALLGHNRHATKGEVVCDNSHPFTHKHITLFHNGTLTSHTNISNNLLFDVDSDAIAYAISETQTDKLPETLEKLKGAYALVWYNSKDKTINFARNEDRPLYIAQTADKKVDALIYGSEPGLISWIVGRNGVTIEAPKLLEVGKLLSIPINIKEEPRVSSFTPHKVEDYYDYSKWNNYYGKQSAHVSGSNSNSTTITTTPNTLKKNVVVSSSVSENEVQFGYLIGTTLILRVETFKPYDTTAKHARYGELQTYFGQVLIKIGGVLSVDSRKFVGKKVRAKLNSFNGHGEGYASFLGVVDDVIVEDDLVDGPLEDDDLLEDGEFTDIKDLTDQIIVEKKSIVRIVQIQ